MGNSKHLRYLGLLGSSTSCTFPSSVCRLHRLKVIEGGSCLIQRFPPDFSDAISLQKVNSKGFDYNKDHSGKLCLNWPGSQSPETVKMMENQMEILPHWDLQHLSVKGYGGESCPSWLQPNLLPMLRSLEFLKCDNLKSIPFFVPLEGSVDNTARSDNIINRLEELVIKACGQINWQGSVVLPTSLRRLTLDRSGNFMDHFVRCFLDLTHLSIIGCESLTSIPLHVWRSNLPSLEELYLDSCDNLTSIVSEASSSRSSSDVKGFSSLAKIRIERCRKLLSMDEFLKRDCLPGVKTIWVFFCGELMSLSVDTLDRLQDLLIIGCHFKLDSRRVMILPSSLKNLRVGCCEGIECINLANSNMASSLPVLEELSITSCPGLKSIGGAAVVDKIKKVNIRWCPELNEIQQPLCRCLVGTADAEIENWHETYGGEEVRLA